MVSTRDMLTALLDGRSISIAELRRDATVIPDMMDAMDALAVLRWPKCRWPWSTTNMATLTGS